MTKDLPEYCLVYYFEVLAMYNFQKRMYLHAAFALQYTVIFFLTNDKW